MAQPKVEKFVTAIDIGSWKVSALIAGRTENGELAILGTGQREDPDTHLREVRPDPEDIDKSAGQQDEESAESEAQGNVDHEQR